MAFGLETPNRETVVKNAKLDSEQLRRVSDAFQRVRIFLEDQSPMAHYTRHSDETSRDAAVQLRKWMRTVRGERSLNYRSPDVYKVFDDTYFYQNLMKCLIASELVLSDNAISRYFSYMATQAVVDVGAGTGVFSLSLALMMKSRGIEAPRTYYLIDAGGFQLKVASHLLVDLCGIQPSGIKTGIFDVLEADFSLPGLRISSYLLPSLGADVNSLGDEVIRRLLGRASIYLDYPTQLKSLRRRADGVKYNVKNYRYSHASDHLMSSLKTTKVNVSADAFWL
jgi:hypothetical protein